MQTVTCFLFSSQNCFRSQKDDRLSVFFSKGLGGVTANGENLPVDILEPLSETETLSLFLLLVDVPALLNGRGGVSPFKLVSVLARLILPGLKDLFNFILELSVILPYLVNAD